MRVAIGVQVSSIEGARYGLPELLDLFDEYKIQATFFVSLGPDRSVSWWRRMVGAPFISDAARAELRRLAESDHEIGLAPFDPVRWDEDAPHADLGWTRRQINPAADIHRRVFGGDPCCLGVAGFQVNPHLFVLEQALGLRYGSDVQGKTIFVPRAQRLDSDCPQIPATLPTVEAALRERGVTEDNVHEHLFDASQSLLPTGHVWRISVEEEGAEFLDTVEKMLVMWRGSQRDIGPLGKLLEPVDLSQLRRHQIGWQRAGRGRYVAAQSLLVD